MVNAVLIATAAAGAFNATRHVARQATTCPTLPVCPANNGCTWYVCQSNPMFACVLTSSRTDPSNGALFKISCSTDFYGADFETAQVANVLNLT